MEQEILQKNLVQHIVQDIFHTVSEDDVLQQINGQWTLKGQPLTEGQIAVLKKEALSFSQCKLFEVLLAELRWHGKNAHNKAKTEADLITSNLLGYFVDVIEAKIKKIALL